MVLAVGGLKGSGESLVMSWTGSSTVSGSGERGAMNTLGLTRAESRMGGVGAATATLNFSTRSSARDQRLTSLQLPFQFSPWENLSVKQTSLRRRSLDNAATRLLFRFRGPGHHRCSPSPCGAHGRRLRKQDRSLFDDNADLRGFRNSKSRRVGGGRCASRRLRTNASFAILVKDLISCEDFPGHALCRPSLG